METPAKRKHGIASFFSKTSNNATAKSSKPNPSATPATGHKHRLQKTETNAHVSSIPQPQCPPRLPTEPAKPSPKPQNPPKKNPFATLMANASKSTQVAPKTAKQSAAKQSTKQQPVRADKVLVKPQDMFDELTKGYPEFSQFCQELGRPLRVATMCSGTESPLLALNMMAKSVSKQSDGQQRLDIDHVFSCEIEPFKQAYIERNFSPPLLFRDIRELGNDQVSLHLSPLVCALKTLCTGNYCVWRAR